MQLINMRQINCCRRIWRSSTQLTTDALRRWVVLLSTFQTPVQNAVVAAHMCASKKKKR